MWYNTTLRYAVITGKKNLLFDKVDGNTVKSISVGEQFLSLKKYFLWEKSFSVKEKLISEIKVSELQKSLSVQ